MMRLNYNTVMHLKDEDGMSNSEDFDQTAPGRVYTVCPDMSVQKLWIIKVLRKGTTVKLLNIWTPEKLL